MRRVWSGPPDLLSDTLGTCFQICEFTLKGNQKHYLKEGICYALLHIATNNAVAHSEYAAVLPTSITMHAAYVLSHLCYGCRADWMPNLLNTIRSVWPNCSRDLQYVLGSIINRTDTAPAAATQDTTRPRQQRSRSPVRRSHHEHAARSSDHTEPVHARRTHYEQSHRRSYSSSRSRSRSRLYNHKRSGSRERQQQRRRRRSMSADSMRRYRSRSRGRRGRSVSVTARYGSSSSIRSAAKTTAATARQWSEAEMPHAAYNGTAAAMAPAAASAAPPPCQDYPMKVLEFTHVNGYTAAAATSTSAAEFNINRAMHDASVVLQCHATDGNGGGYSNSYAPQQVPSLI
jgi:hypothetical protein